MSPPLCADCNGPKSDRRRTRCLSCYRKLHPANYCTDCGARCKKRYRRCLACRGVQVTDTCPDCGGRKTLRAKRCRACQTAFATGKNHPCWKGGRVSIADGYVRVYAPDHPRAQNGRYALEHVLVMEEMLGRALYSDERVHHRNKVRDDNRPENLELWSVGHPSGARVEDLVTWAREVIDRYEQ